MRLKTIYITFVVVFFFCTFSNATWYSGIIHGPHTTFSDGVRSPEEAQKKAIESGASFDCFTDHYESIASIKKQPYQSKKDSGYENYSKRLSTVPGLVCLSGTEIKARFQNHNTHTLAVGKIKKDQELDRLQGGQGNQQAIINQILAKRLIPIAAHPSAISTGSLTKDPTDPTNYYYDRTNAKGLMGIEFGNESAECAKNTLAWYLDISNRSDVFATFGNDSHFPFDKDDPERWQRKTYVWIDGALTEDSLMEALRNGRTYEANNKIEILDINYRPGFQSQKVDRPRFEVKVKIAKNLNWKKMKVYRNGKLVGLAFGEETSDGRNYRFFDEQVEIGKHRYILEIEDMLITSPIVLDVAKSYLPRTDKGRDSKGKNGLNPEDTVWEYIQIASKHSQGNLNDYYAHSAVFPNLNSANFLEGQKLKKFENRDFGWKSSAVYSGKVYQVNGYTRCDVYLELAKDPIKLEGRNHTTWMMVLENGNWKIMDVVDNFCIYGGKNVVW